MLDSPASAPGSPLRSGSVVPRSGAPLPARRRGGGTADQPPKRREERLAGAANGLGDADEVALAVIEERAELGISLARIVVRGDDRIAPSLESGHLETLEGHAAGSQISQRRLEILDLESHLRRLPRCLPG